MARSLDVVLWTCALINAHARSQARLDHESKRRRTNNALCSLCGYKAVILSGRRDEEHVEHRGRRRRLRH